MHSTSPFDRSDALSESLIVASKATATLLLLIVLAGCSVFSTSSYDKIVYGGVSGNISRLDPDTESSTVFSVADGQSGGAGVILGIDLSERFSSELRYTDLGSATLSPSAFVDYEALGASLLYYGLGDAVAIENRTGLAGFARAGLNLMMHDSNIDLDAEDNVQFVAGLGVDYMLGNRWAIRTEFDFHDVDAQALHLGVLYRFGSQSRQQTGPRPRQPIPQRPQVVDAPDRTPRPVVTPRPEVTPLPRPTQPQVAEPGQPVEPTIIRPAPEPDVTDTPASTSLVLANGVISGVNFATGSARLNENAFRVLDQLASELRQQPATRIELQVHTNGVPGARPCLLYTSPSPRDATLSRMPSSA